MKPYKTLVEWKEIGRQMKLIRAYYFEKLFPLLNGIPKKHRKAGTAFDNKYSKLKSNLEDLFAEEYPDDFDTHVFYGDSEMQTVNDLERKSDDKGNPLNCEKAEPESTLNKGADDKG